MNGIVAFLKKTGKKRLIFLSVILLLLLFLFVNSSFSQKTSRAVSTSITSVINGFLSIFGISGISDNLTRKIAHFVEYSVMGSLIFVYCVLGGQKTKKHALYCLLITHCVGLADETYQLFTNRGSTVSDVLLDTASAAVGILIVFLIVNRSSKAIDKKTINEDAEETKEPFVRKKKTPNQRKKGTARKKRKR